MLSINCQSRQPRLSELPKENNWSCHASRQLSDLKKKKKKWYTQKQSLDKKLLGISRKQQNKKKETKRGRLAQKVLSYLLK